MQRVRRESRSVSNRLIGPLSDSQSRISALQARTSFRMRIWTCSTIARKHGRGNPSTSSNDCVELRPRSHDAVPGSSCSAQISPPCKSTTIIWSDYRTLCLDSRTAPRKNAKRRKPGAGTAAACVRGLNCRFDSASKFAEEFKTQLQGRSAKEVPHPNLLQ